jgi:cytochrome c oxidase subunit 2
VLVDATLVLCVVTYRGRGRPRLTPGAQVHGHARIEIIWTVVPAVILAVIAAFVFYELPGIKNLPAASAAGRQNIRIDAHQFYWQFTYPNGAVSIDELHVPVGAAVPITVVSGDVAHSWWVPALAGKIDAIPGQTNHSWFQAKKAGRFPGKCAEFCGIFHTSMDMSVIAESQTEYEAFLAKAPTELGKAEFEGVCSKCHGLAGKGDYGPALAGNGLVADAGTIGTIVRNGRGKMPAVGKTWTDTQMKALTDYLKQHVANGGAGGG